MSLTDVTDRDRARWSVHASYALTEILEAAYLAHMPPLIWQLTGLGLVGTVPDGSRVPAEFRQWVQHLDLVLDREIITSDHMRHMVGIRSYLTRRRCPRADRSYRVNVTVRASSEVSREVPAPPIL